MRIENSGGVDAGQRVDEAELERAAAQAEAARALAEAERARAEAEARAGLDGVDAFEPPNTGAGGAARAEPGLPDAPAEFDVASLYADEPALAPAPAPEPVQEQVQESAPEAVPDAVPEPAAEPPGEARAQPTVEATPDDVEGGVANVSPDREEPEPSPPEQPVVPAAAASASPHEHQIALNRATRELAEGALSFERLDQLVAQGSFTAAEADRIRADGIARWKDEQARGFVAGLTDGTKSAAELNAYVNQGHFSRAQADAIAARAQDNIEAQKAQAAAELARRVSTGEVSFDKLDDMVAAGSLTREQADKARDDGAARWKKEREAEIVEGFSRGALTDDDVAGYVADGHFSASDVEGMRARGAVRAQERADAELVEQLATGAMSQEALAGAVASGSLTQEKADALLSRASEVWQGRKDAERDAALAEQVSRGEVSFEDLDQMVTDGALTRAEADRIRDQGARLWQGRTAEEMVGKLATGEASHDDLMRLVDEGHLTRDEAEGVSQAAGAVWRDQTARDLVARIGTGSASDEEMAQLVRDGHFTSEQMEQIQHAGADLKNAERNAALVEELASGALSQEALADKVASGELTQREADMLLGAATEVWQDRRAFDLADKLSRGELSHEQLDEKVASGELSQAEADAIREAGGMLWQERTASELVDRMTRGEVADDELAQLVADGTFTQEQVDAMRGLADEIKKADEEQTTRDDALIAQLRSGEVSQDDFIRMIESGELSVADVERIVARDAATGGASVEGAGGAAVVEALSEDDIATLGRGHKADRQMLWSEQAIALTRQRSFEQGLMSQEKSNENHALAADVVLGRDRGADPASEAHVIDAGSLAAIARQSGIALDRVDVSQLQSALPYLNEAKSKDEQAERLKNVLDQLHLVDAGKKPQFTHTDVKGMAWDLARIGGHAVDNVKNPADIQKLFDDLASRGNTPGDHKLKVGKHEVKFTIDPTNAYIDGSGSTKSTGGFLKTLGKIGQIALTAASFIPPIGVVATVANAAISAVKAAKNGNILGAIASAAGGFAAGLGGLVSSVGKGFSDAAKTTLGHIQRGFQLGSQGIQAGQAIASGNLLNIVQGGAGFLGVGAGLTQNAGIKDALTRAQNLVSSGLNVGRGIASGDIGGAIAGGLAFTGLAAAHGQGHGKDATGLERAMQRASQIARVGDTVADAVQSRSLAGLITAGFSVSGALAGRDGHSARGELVTHLGAFANGVISGARRGDVWGAINAGARGVGQLVKDGDALKDENAAIRARLEAERARAAATASGTSPTTTTRTLTPEQQRFLDAARADVSALEGLMGQPRVVGGLHALAQNGVDGLAGAADELSAALQGGTQAEIDAAMAKFNAAREQARTVHTALAPLARDVEPLRSQIATPASLTHSELRSTFEYTVPPSDARQPERIMAAFGASPAEFARLNPHLVRADGTLDENRVRAGAVVRLPFQSEDPAGAEAFRRGYEASTTVRITGRYAIEQLAVMNGLTTAEVLAANPGLDPTRLRVGDTIRLPLRANDEAAAERFANGVQATQTVRAAERALEADLRVGNSYAVRSGDTLASIAARNGLTVEQLRAANPALPADGRLMATQRLVIPGEQNFVPRADGTTGYVRPSELEVYRHAALSTATGKIDAMLRTLEGEAARQQSTGGVGTAVADTAIQFATWVMSGGREGASGSIAGFQNDNIKNVEHLRRKFEEAKRANNGVVDETWVRTFLGSDAWGNTPPPGVRIPPLPPGVPPGTHVQGMLQNAAGRLGDTSSYRQAQVDLTQETLLQIGVAVATAGYGSVVGVGSRAAVNAGTAGVTWLQAGVNVGLGAGAANAGLGLALDGAGSTIGGFTQDLASGFATGFGASAFNGAFTSGVLGSTSARVGREIAEGFVGDASGNALAAGAQGATWFGQNGSFDFTGGVGRVGAAVVQPFSSAVDAAQRGDWLTAIGAVATGPAITAGVHVVSGGRLPTATTSPSASTLPNVGAIAPDPRLQNAIAVLQDTSLPAPDRLQAARDRLDAAGVRYREDFVTVTNGSGQQSRVPSIVIEGDNRTALGRAAQGIGTRVGSDIVFSPAANDFLGAHGFYQSANGRGQLAVNETDIIAANGITTPTSRHELEHALEDRATRLGGDPRRVDAAGNTLPMPRGDLGWILHADPAASPYGPAYAANEVTAFETTVRSDLLDARAIVRRAELANRPMTDSEWTRVQELMGSARNNADRGAQIATDVIDRFTEARASLGAPGTLRRTERSGTLYVELPANGASIHVPIQVPGGAAAARNMSDAHLRVILQGQLTDGIARARKAGAGSQSTLSGVWSLLYGEGAIRGADDAWARRQELLAVLNSMPR